MSVSVLNLRLIPAVIIGRDLLGDQSDSAQGGVYTLLSLWKYGLESLWRLCALCGFYGRCVGSGSQQDRQRQVDGNADRVISGGHQGAGADSRVDADSAEQERQEESECC